MCYKVFWGEIMIFSNKKAFTLIEIMLVIILLGILYTTISYNGGFAIERASKASINVDIGVYEIAITDVLDKYEVNNFDEISGYINDNIEGQFKVQVVSDHLESIGRTDKNGNRYEIYTEDFYTFKIVCGDVEKVIQKSVIQ